MPLVLARSTIRRSASVSSTNVPGSSPSNHTALIPSDVGRGPSKSFGVDRVYPNRSRYPPHPPANGQFVTNLPRPVLRAPIPHARRAPPVRPAAPELVPAPTAALAQHMETHVASEATTISSGGGLADRYAAALYAHADEHHVLDSVVSQMESLGRLIDASSDFRRLLQSPADRREDRHRGRPGGADGRKASARKSAISSASSRSTAAWARCATSSAPSPPWWPNGAASSPLMSRRRIR